MTAFEYTITDSIGIHARPAGMLAKEAAKYKSKVFLHFGDKKSGCTPPDRHHGHGHQARQHRSRGSGR